MLERGLIFDRFVLFHRSFVRFIVRENWLVAPRPAPIAGFERKVDSEHADVDAVLNMAPTDQETNVVPPAEEPEEMPLPSDPKVIFLGGLFVLALLAVAYVASEIVLPLVFAIILKLLLQPAVRILQRLRVPRILAALLLILALFGTIVGLGTAISGPAGTWAAKLPEGIPRLQERLSFMREPIDTVQRFLQQVEDLGETGPSPNAAASARSHARAALSAGQGAERQQPAPDARRRRRCPMTSRVVAKPRLRHERRICRRCWPACSTSRPPPACRRPICPRTRTPTTRKERHRVLSTAVTLRCGFCRQTSPRIDNRAA